MIANIVILLVVVAVIAVLTGLIGSSNGGVLDTITSDKPKEEPLMVEESDKIEENSIGTLSDRAVAAIQYQRLQNSFEKNCGDKDVPDKAKVMFRQVARQLATIGTNVNPEEVDIPSKDGLPLGWDLK